MAVDPSLLLEQQLCFALYRANQAMAASYRARLGAQGLTYPQYLVLLVLLEGDRRSVGDISRRLGLDSGTLTPLLKRLERDGHVARERSRDDERVVLVRLTPQGRSLRRHASSARRGVAVETGLTSAELDELRARLHRLADALDESRRPAAGATD